MPPLNVPNVLTVFRILLVPVLVVALLEETDSGSVVAAIVFAVAASTDGLDGYLAGGMTSWRQERREVDRTERLELADLRDRVQGEEGLQILDVRELVAIGLVVTASAGATRSAPSRTTP